MKIVEVGQQLPGECAVGPGQVSQISLIFDYQLSGGAAPPCLNRIKSAPPVESLLIPGGRAGRGAGRGGRPTAAGGSCADYHNILGICYSL